MGICAPGSSSCFTAKRDEARPVFTIVALPDISAGINYCLTNTPNGQPSAISAVPCTSADVAKPSLLFTNVPHSSKNYTFQYISKLDNQCIYYHSNTKFGLTFCNSQDPSQFFTLYTSSSEQVGEGFGPLDNHVLVKRQESLNCLFANPNGGTNNIDDKLCKDSQEMTWFGIKH